MVSYLEQNHLDEPVQSTSKKFHSCDTALVRMHHDMLSAIDKRCWVALLLLDLSATSDTVDHNILLQRVRLGSPYVDWIGLHPIWLIEHGLLSPTMLNQILILLSVVYHKDRY